MTERLHSRPTSVTDSNAGSSDVDASSEAVDSSVAERPAKNFRRWTGTDGAAVAETVMAPFYGRPGAP